MTHFDHPRELTNKSLDAIKSIQDCGVVCLNQCPLINGVNDNAHVLAELFENLSFAGCTPYYLFQCSPTEGNNQYLTTIVDGYHVFSEAVSRVSGIAGTAKYCFSHKTGKIEILLIDDRNIYLKYHRTHINENINRVIVCERNNKAKSFEDLRQR
jgi:L-lysine 2,3-aminomutase